MKNQYIKIILVFWLIIFCNSAPGTAKAKFKIGVNASYLENTKNSYPRFGPIFAVSNDFLLSNKFCVSGELNALSKYIRLENKHVSPYSEVDVVPSYRWDIKGIIGFLEIPILVKYIVFKSNHSKINIYFGPSYSVPLIDFTSFSKKEYVSEYNPNNAEFDEYDYHFQMESGFGNNKSVFNLNFGIEYYCKNFIFELGYSLDKRGSYYFSNLSRIKNNIHSIYFVLSKK